MDIEELKKLAQAANAGFGCLPWQITMARNEHGATGYYVRGHCEPGIAVVKDQYWEDSYNPPVDDCGYLQPDERMDCDPVRVDIARYIAAANPATVLGLIAEIERLRDEVNGLTGTADALERQLNEARNNDITAMGYLADCRIASGDNGKRMLPDFVEYLRETKQQRDELLSSLRDVVGWVPGREKWHTDEPIKAVNRACAAIANAEKTK